jgi:hypothetical protein
MGSWHKFHQLSWLERWLLVQALLLLPLIALALRLFGFRPLHTALANLTSTNCRLVSNKTQAALAQAYSTVRIVRAAIWYGPYHANCLQQSLVLWWLLRCQGIESDLRIGVRKQASRFEAHAWVEYLGLALNDSSDVYQRFAAFNCVIVPVGVKAQ